MRFLPGLVASFTCPSISLAADVPMTIRGIVLNQQAEPVAARMSISFGAQRYGQGQTRPATGSKIEANRREFWGHVGEMAPGRDREPGEIRQTGPDGRFSLSIKEAPAFTLVAMDRDRTHGGLVIIPKHYSGARTWRFAWGHWCACMDRSQRLPRIVDWAGRVPRSPCPTIPSGQPTTRG